MRLIDADKIKEFTDYYTELEGEPLNEREQLLVTCVCEKIRELMPTAYDVDRVVERIKELPTKVFTSDTGAVPIYDSVSGKFEGFTKSYEIKKDFVRKDEVIKIVESIKIIKTGMGTDIEEKEECSSAKEET